MGFVVTLSDFTPLERTDGVHWTHALIEEAATPDGSWTEIQDVTLDPVDTDPAHPMVRTLTSSNATIEVGGWYRVIWQDDLAGRSSPTAPIENVAEDTTGIRPTVGEVAKLLRARTKVRGGGEVGTFTSSTRPTADEVEGMISDAIDEVLGKVQLPTPGSGYERRVRGAVRLYTAMLVELSYYPEQARTNESPFSSYQALYNSRVKALVAEGETGSPQGMGGDGSGGDSPANAAWFYPDDDGGLVGWQSEW